MHRRNHHRVGPGGNGQFLMFGNEPSGNWSVTPISTSVSAECSTWALLALNRSEARCDVIGSARPCRAHRMQLCMAVHAVFRLECVFVAGGTLDLLHETGSSYNSPLYVRQGPSIGSSSRAAPRGPKTAATGDSSDHQASGPAGLPSAETSPPARGWPASRPRRPAPAAKPATTRACAGRATSPGPALGNR